MKNPTSILPLLLLFLLPSTAPDIASDRAALLAFRAAVRGRALLWNTSAAASPCSWSGIKCSPENSSVVEVRLPGKSLSGHLPENTISNLTNLRTLSLRSNSLSGPLPPDLFQSLKSLRNLYLHRNSFTGEIPDSLFSLTSIVHLNLADNNFSGPISPGFNSLSRLKTLYLQNNHLSGTIDHLTIPNLIEFNVSNNNLIGKIPLHLSSNPKSSFIGNSLCGVPLDPCGNKSALSKRLMTGIIVGCFLLVLLFILLLFLWRRSRARKGVSPTNEGKGSSRMVTGEWTELSRGFPTAALVNEGNVKNRSDKEFVFFGNIRWNFDLEDLLRASAEVLGKGAYGTSYKVTLEAGLVVVVKRVKEVSVGVEDFKKMMEEIGRMDHENLVPLKGYYSRDDEKLLVYEYLAMGSLSSLLHGDKTSWVTPMNWEMRAAMARGTARGILYIHSQGESISHGNIRSSNVLLTESYEARVSDVGLAQVAVPSLKSAYCAPEVTDPHKISRKADVYSFGVLLLELLSGKCPMYVLLTNEEGLDLPKWVRSMDMSKRNAQLFDLELQQYQNVEEDMVQILQLALDCTEQLPEKRPTMVEVTNKIEEVCSWSLQDTLYSVDDEEGGIH